MARKGLYANGINAKGKLAGKKKVQKVHQKNLLRKKTAKSIMTKLCPRGKAAAKRKFKVYPRIC